MATVTIEGYLLQRKLEDALRQIVGDAAWKGRELRVPDSRARWDMAYEVSGQTTVVEFDGDSHYRDPMKMKRDRQKDEVAASLGYRVVRVPYWVQLTNETLLHYFDLRANIVQDFPHGFIATKLFPASYCPMGIERFARELQGLPKAVKEAVCSSLVDRVNEHGLEYVLPPSLTSLVD